MSSSLAGRATPPVDVLIDVPLHFEVGGEAVHAPMVDVRIGAVETLLIVDTGSTDHVLTIELAGHAGLETRAGDAGTDHIGRAVTSWDVGTAPIRIGDVAFTLRDAVAIAAPARFEAWGVGGFLSPQHLHPTADVVIDLVDDRLLVVDADRADVVAWLMARSPAFRPMSLERVPDDAEILVNAGIDPFDPVATMLNTGGRGTEFAAAAVPGLGHTGREHAIRGVSGETAPGLEAERQVLRIGDAAFPVERLLIRGSMGAAQGLVGMDLLRGTILLINADRRRSVVWFVPRPADARC